MSLNDAPEGSASTIVELLDARRGLGDKQLLVTDYDSLTYGEADRRSQLIAGALMAAGVGRGSRVGLLFGNGSGFVLSFLAVTRIGAIAMPFSTLSTQEELHGLLDSSDAQFLIADTGYRGRDFATLLHATTGATPGEPIATASLPVLRHMWVGLQPLESAGAPYLNQVIAAEAQVTAADMLALIHTSGSTSRPKGVIHTQGAVLRNMARQNQIRRYTSEDRLFSNSPFFWIGGLAFSLLSTIIAGAELICSAGTQTQTLDLLERERPTMANGFAASVLPLAQDPSIAQRDLSSLRRGNLYPIMPPELRPADPQLRHGLLGLTETGSVCLLGDHENDLPEHQRGSFGYPVPQMQARVVDFDTGLDASEGELWLRGPAMMQGYYGFERHSTFTETGWWRSGDVVRVDRDGLFYFLGRRGDIIKTAGANVSPREIEAVLNELMPTRLSIVIGVPDPTRGQLITAVVVGDEPVDEASLQATLSSRLSRYKVPRRIVTMPDAQVPRLSSGKLNLKKLVEMLSVR